MCTSAFFIVKNDFLTRKCTYKRNQNICYVLWNIFALCNTWLQRELRFFDDILPVSNGIPKNDNSTWVHWVCSRIVSI